MKAFNVGDAVSVTEREEAYYSGYAGNPVCFLEPGETGVIGSVNVPKVYRTPGGAYFCCVDFVKGGRQWRAGVDYGKLKLVKHAACS